MFSEIGNDSNKEHRKSFTWKNDKNIAEKVDQVFLFPETSSESESLHIKDMYIFMKTKGYHSNQ